MIDCERCWTVLHKIQCKTLANDLWFGECSCLRHWKHLYSWERITQTIYTPRSQMFEISEELILDQSDEMSGVSQIRWKSFSRKTVISGQWWRSHQSVACNGLCILRFCVMSWKDESEPNIKFCLGTTVGLVQGFITIHNFGHNWRRTDGIRVKYFSRIHHKIGEPEQFQGRIIFMSMFNDIIFRSKDKWNGMYC